MTIEAVELRISISPHFKASRNLFVLNLNNYAKSVRQEGGDKVRASSKGFPHLGTLFSQILSSFCLMV